ncbi:hypothetical protein AQJ66_04875 [Streptomyces bungoensis]|uniref:STAS domain-containing protein n=1 Tax=Streptomyces bungoensis TaxID=285568 RepID=A0A101TBW8_9ACTN|nr:STAS domain-containing protein [Streptomyces bungoensis]KUN89497.1 hypothetical protein AQJ66_04875 [Streptomyces bungoensis]
MEQGQLSSARVRPAGPAPLHLRAVRERRPGGGGITVLKARGTVDASNAAEFSESLAGHLAEADRAGEAAVLDMAELYLASAVAVRSLDRATGGLALAGRCLPIVQPRPHVREALRLAGLPGVRAHATLASAVHSLEAQAQAGAGQGPGAGPAGG